MIKKIFLCIIFTFLYSTQVLSFGFNVGMNLKNASHPLWVKNLGGNFGAYGGSHPGKLFHTKAQSSAIDSSGNVYVTGDTNGNLESCFGVSANCHGSSEGQFDYFISKYTNAGVWLWTKQLGFSGYTVSNSITIDSSGNAYVAGYTEDNLVSCNGVSANCIGSSKGVKDYFISKYSSAGVWLWTKQMGQTLQTTEGKSITVDSSGYIYVTGNTNGNLVSCNGVSANCLGSSKGSNDYFISKYDSAGAWLWTKQLGETSKTTIGNSIALDSLDNVYVTGKTNGNLVSCNGVSANCLGSSEGSNDYFISKYDSAGAWLWTKQLGETSKSTSGNSIALDSLGNVYVTGDTNGNLVSCNGVSANCLGSSEGSNDYFISKYDNNGAWQWTKQLGGTNLKTTRGSAIAIDTFGNVYVTGTTSGNLVSCNGVSATCLGSSKGTIDYFISKYDSAGAWLWTKQLGEITAYTNGNSIALDSLGNVYITGYTAGNLVSCNGVSANCLGSSQGTSDYFISKYNSAGSWQWTKQLGETFQTTEGKSIAVDTLGNVYVTGYTVGNLVSCNGASANCLGISQGHADYFISKYNSAGTWLWTKQLGETSNSTIGNSIAIDFSGNIYVTGFTDGNLVSCNGVSANCLGSSQGYNDYFISKYDNNGAWQWTKQLGGTNLQTTRGLAIALDSLGNIYVTGYTDGNLVSCNGVSASCLGSSQGTSDYFISKYNSAGSWQWTKQLGETTASTIGYSIALDSLDNVYVTGSTEGNLVSCNGVSATCLGSSQGIFDYFISKYDSTGAWLWTKQLGETTAYTNGKSIALDSLGNVYVTGYTAGNLVSCNGVSATCLGSSQGYVDYFISKYDSAGTWLWTKQLGETSHGSYGNSIAIDSSGSVYVTGETDGNLVSCNGVSANCSGISKGGYDYYISKYNSTGNWKWTKQLGKKYGETYSNGIAINKFGEINIVGTTEVDLKSCNGVLDQCTNFVPGAQNFILKYRPQ